MSVFGLYEYGRTPMRTRAVCVLAMAVLIIPSITVEGVSLTCVSSVFSCRADGDDPANSISWTLVKKDGSRFPLGTCLRNRYWICSSEVLQPDVGRFSVHGWSSSSSVIMFSSLENISGHTLVCSASTNVNTTTAECDLGSMPYYSACGQGESDCNSRGWPVRGYMGSSLVCCPASNSFIMNMKFSSSYFPSLPWDRPCQCRP